MQMWLRPKAPTTLVKRGSSLWLVINNNMCVCSVVSKQKAIKVLYLIYIKLAAAKSNMYVCVVST